MLLVIIMSDAGAETHDPLTSHHEEEQQDAGNVENSHPGKDGEDLDQREERGSSEESEKSDGDGSVPEIDQLKMTGNPVLSQVYTATMDTLLSTQKPHHVRTHALVKCPDVYFFDQINMVCLVPTVYSQTFLKSLVYRWKISSLELT